MSLLSVFKKKKEFFSAEEQKQIINAIRAAEKATSGEIRIFVESKNRFVDPIDRASEIFFKLNMHSTAHRNGVLLYIAMDSHELALFADEGIYREVGKDFWNDAVKKMLAEFSKQHMCEAIVECVRKVGATLTQKFPYHAEDKNELPDDIVFGH